MNEANLLLTIPSRFIAAGSRNLPKAATSTDEILQAVVDVPGIGRVCFTYKRTSQKNARSTTSRTEHNFSGTRHGLAAPHYFWLVETAELIA